MADPPEPARVTHPSGRYVQLFDFLDAEEYASLLRHVAERLDSASPSGVVNRRVKHEFRDETVRRSRLIGDVDLVFPMFESRLRALLPEVRDALGIPPFEVERIERHITVHGDGDFFVRHRDETNPWTDGCRVLTFVYYFHEEPPSFEGGQLRLYDTVTNRRGVTVAAPSYRTIEPVSNSIVFFSASDTFHEVAPVQAIGSGADALRCTLNGWFRAGDLGRPAPPWVDNEVLSVIAHRLLPALTDQGFAVRPTPEPAGRLLQTLWELRMAAGLAPDAAEPTRPPDATEGIPDAAEPERIPLGPFGDDLLERLRPVHEEWVGRRLEPVVASAIQVHRSGTQTPLRVAPVASDVISSLIVIDEDLDEPWPFVLATSDAIHEIPVAPGQMVTYEGARIPHGRAHRLGGRFQACITVHYRPQGWPHTRATLVDHALADGLIDDDGRLAAP